MVAALQALSMVGREMPAVFAGFAADLADFIVSTVLPHHSLGSSAADRKTVIGDYAMEVVKTSS